MIRHSCHRPLIDLKVNLMRCFAIWGLEAGKTQRGQETYKAVQKNIVDMIKGKERWDSIAALLNNLNMESSTKDKQPKAEENDVKKTRTMISTAQLEAAAL